MTVSVLSLMFGGFNRRALVPLMLGFEATCALDSLLFKYTNFIILGEDSVFGTKKTRRRETPSNVNAITPLSSNYFEFHNIKALL